MNVWFNEKEHVQLWVKISCIWCLLSYHYWIINSPSPMNHRWSAEASLVFSLIFVVVPQHLIVSEGICAMLCLARLDVARSLPSAGTVWTALTHPEKHALLHDRTLHAISEDGNYCTYVVVLVSMNFSLHIVVDIFKFFLVRSYVYLSFCILVVCHAQFCFKWYKKKKTRLFAVNLKSFKEAGLLCTFVICVLLLYFYRIAL